jgi:Ala-tRNA(Pro) deacylase
MGSELLSRIKGLLDERGVSYKHLTHGFVHSSHDAAKVRGNRVEQAAKAIVLKVKGGDGYFFVQCVLPGHKRIDLRKLKVLLGVKKASLASADEVLSVTGCSIGSVPPFGFFFGLKVYADKSLLGEEEVVFSAGTHFDSVVLSTKDFLGVVNPLLVDFVVE